jgi:hypothetical protein
MSSAAAMPYTVVLQVPGIRQLPDLTRCSGQIRSGTVRESMGA